MNKENTIKKTFLTGDRPTGKLHLGHYVGSLNTRVEMQNSGLYNPFIMIADMQALTDNAKNPEKIRKNLREVALDYLSVGINPEKSVIFIQSRVPELCEMTMYFSNLVTLSRLQRNPTIKQEIKLRGFEKSIPVGFLTYPISQAADILAFDTDVVPVGEDQLPMVEQTQEIVQSFNATYGNLFKNPVAVVPSAKSRRRLLGLDGKKMSKSANNAIYLSDTTEVLRTKVMSMYTDPNHIHVEDKGQVDGNMVFTYLDVFGSDKAKIKEMKEHYKAGGLGDVTVKKYLLQVLEELLTPIRERRKYYEQHINLVDKILIDGSNKAQAIATNTLKRIRKAIGVEYFDN
ncbi:MAG: tryptophan--tRNA ligase [Clostridia bacterium]|jgi:tryptophanyl-tRNA synthetase|nr:tryptophan--tRNA ligase [Clostridia bacterium]MDD4275738.1 tryptophan--tRNA ligase [Clostridia bacterium]